MTIGTHIFAPPEAVRDMHLMGHELSHVNENLNGTRETGKSNGAGVTVTDPGQNSELKADRDGVSFAAGAASAPSVVTQRATRKTGTPATAGGETETEPTVQRAPSGYDYSSYYTDDVPMVIDAEPGYGSSSGYPQVSYSSYTLPPGYEGREDDRGRSSSRASYGYSSRLHALPPATGRTWKWTWMMAPHHRRRSRRFFLQGALWLFEAVFTRSLPRPGRHGNGAG